MIAHQKVQVKPADILMIRTGWVKKHNESSAEERKAGVRDQSNFVGVKGCEESVRWIWDHHFAAVAGDQITFEAWPPNKEWCE